MKNARLRRYPAASPSPRRGKRSLPIHRSDFTREPFIKFHKNGESLSTDYFLIPNFSAIALALWYSSASILLNSSGDL